VVTMWPRQVVAALLAVVTYGLMAEAFACSCSPPPPPCEAFGRASAVFTGRAVGGSKIKKVESGGETHILYSGEVSFEVSEAFTGVTGKQITVWASDGDCAGGPFAAGDSYLVYAYEAGGKKLYVSGCNRTKSLDVPVGIDVNHPYWRDYWLHYRKEVEDDLAFLRNLPKRGSGARIYGVVAALGKASGKENEEAAAYFSPAVNPLPDVSIKVQGKQKSIELRTDGGGKFDLKGLPPGKYSIEVVKPGGYVAPSTHHLKQTFLIRDCACVQVNYFLRADGRIKGRLFDEEGRPLAKVEVQLISADRQTREFKKGREEYLEVESNETDEEGRYELGPLPPGRYLLGVGINGPTPNSPYRPTFYPNAPGLARAVEIDLGLGQHKADFNLFLTPQFVVHTIQGTVLLPDGSPAAHARVYLQRPSDVVNRNETASDEEGHFTVKGLNGHQYRLKAYWSSKDVELMRKSGGVVFAESEEMTIVVSGNVVNLKVVLSKQWKQ
jgi:hypothetical protein